MTYIKSRCYVMLVGKVVDVTKLLDNAMRLSIENIVNVDDPFIRNRKKFILSSSDFKLEGTDLEESIDQLTQLSVDFDLARKCGVEKISLVIHRIYMKSGNINDFYISERAIHILNKLGMSVDMDLYIE